LLAEIGQTAPRLLNGVQHRSAAVQADLDVLRGRNAAVRARTLLINSVRGHMKSHGHRIQGCSTKSFHGAATKRIPLELQSALYPLVRAIEALNREIAVYEQKIEQLADESYLATKLLRQVPGVGALTALSYVLTIEEPGRIHDSRSAGAYFGLVPRSRASGSIDPQLRITKEGDGEMRRLLVISANYILGAFGPDCDLRRFGLAIAERGGKNARKRAKVAVARKLAVLLHHLWRTGEVYDPFYVAKQHGQAVPA